MTLDPLYIKAFVTYWVGRVNQLRQSWEIQKWLSHWIDGRGGEGSFMSDIKADASEATKQLKLSSSDWEQEWTQDIEACGVDEAHMQDAISIIRRVEEYIKKYNP